MFCNFSSVKYTKSATNSVLFENDIIHLVFYIVFVSEKLSDKIFG